LYKVHGIIFVFLFFFFFFFFFVFFKYITLKKAASFFSEKSVDTRRHLVASHSNGASKV
jgi:hypothetical protein